MTTDPTPDWTPAGLALDLPEGVVLPAWLEGRRVALRRDPSGAAEAREAEGPGASLACAEAGGLLWIARERPAGPPPDLAGWAPLRSLAVEAPASALAAAAGVAPGPVLDLPARDGAPALRLLVQERPGGAAVHALARPAGAPALVAASRALEALRRAAEGPTAEDGA